MALSYTKKTYTDAASSGSGVSASDLNKMENGISDAIGGVNDINSKFLIDNSSGQSIKFTKNANGNHEIWFNDPTVDICIFFSENQIGVYNATTKKGKSINLS